MRAREPAGAKKGSSPQAKPASPGGRPLPAATSARLGAFFGEAVDQVRIHDDASAAARAAAMGAHAFTEGDHIHFAEGRFAPGMRIGEALLAHEVAHALQQRRGVASGRRDGAGAVEAEAHAAGFAFFRGEARAPGKDLGDGLALRRCNGNPAGRPPTEDEAKRLREYAFYRSLLEARRIDEVNAEQQQEVALKATLGTGDEASQRAVRNALDANRTAVQERVTEIDRTRAAVEFEEKSLQDSLRYARPDEPIVWLDIPALGIGGWAPEHLAEMQKSMQAEPAYAAGVKDAKRYWAARSKGAGAAEAIAQIGLVKAGELVGVTQIAEAIKGREVITGEELTGPERVLRAVVGVASVVSFASAVGPRGGGWSAGVKGGQVRLVRMAGPGGIVMAMGEGAAPLVLTAVEVRSLAVAGVGNLSLSMATTGGSGGPGEGGPGDPEVDADTAQVSQAAKDLRALGPADNPSKGWGKGQIPCFPRGTLVSTPGGPRPIEGLGPGDLVLAFDLAAGVACAREVDRRFDGETSAWVDVALEGGSLRATRRHPFWVESSGAWVEAAELAPGMRVRLRDGSTRAVARIAVTALDRPQPTCNLLVPGADNFFAGPLEVLVHNGAPAMDEAKHSNYVLKRNGDSYYTGRFGPNETPASVKARHANPTRSPGRFSEAAGDVMEVLPGTRTYGEARRLEHELCVRLKTFIGRVKGNYRGNRDYPMDAKKLKDYYKPEACP